MCLLSDLLLQRGGEVRRRPAGGLPLHAGHHGGGRQERQHRATRRARPLRHAAALLRGQVDAHQRGHLHLQ